MNWCFLYFSLIVLPIASFSVQTKGFSLDRFVKQSVSDLQIKKTITNKNHLKTSRNSLWKSVSFFRNSNLDLYQFIKNPNILISIQREKGVSQISDLNHFFNQVEKEKTAILSRVSIRNRTVSSSKREKFKNTVLFHTKGTYVDFQKHQVFFEDWSFYHNKLSLYIVIHNTKIPTKQESQAIDAFIGDIINSEPSLTFKEKKGFPFLIAKINKDDN